MNVTAENPVRLDELAWVRDATRKESIEPYEVMYAISDIRFQDRTSYDNSGFVLPARALRTMGSGAAEIILDHITDAAQGAPLWADKETLYTAFYLCATEDNAEQAVRHLADSIPGELPHSLFKALARIANYRVAPYLTEYSEQLMKDNSLGLIQKSVRLERVLGVAFAAKQRAVDPVEIEMWEDRINALIGIADDDGHALLRKDRPQELAEAYHPDRIAIEYSNEFFCSLRDPYFGASTRHDFFLITHDMLPQDRAAVPEKLHLLADELGDDAGSVIETDMVPPGSHETRPHPDVATIGIDVEIEDQSMMDRRQGSSIAEREMYMLDQQVRFRLAEKAGVPAGKDEVWEFAHRPVHDWRTLGREVLALVRLGLVNPDYTDAPMHLTIGGISQSYDGGTSVGVFMHALEATGWSTSSRRIRRPIDGDRDYSWACDSRGNVHERYLDRVVGQDYYAVEMRALAVQGLANLMETLHSAQMIGSALLAHQTSLEARTPDRQRLADIWTDFSAGIVNHFARSNYGFDKDKPVYDVWKCRKEQDGTIHIDPGYLNMARLLQQADSDNSSVGAHFRSGVREIVVDARNQVGRVLYPGEC